MEDLNVKIKNPILVAQPVQAGKDSTTTLAQAFSQAFTQFLNKGAARANHALPLAMIPTATVPPASRESYAPAPMERPLPARADDPARFESAPPPAAKSADDRPAPAQSSHRENANDNTENSANAASASAPSSDDDAEGQAADRSSAAATDAKDTGAPKAAVTHIHAKGVTEKLVEGEHPGRKAARAAKTRPDDDRTPMEVAQNVLVALAADPRPVADRDQAQQDSTENADDAAADPHRADGIANALARLARNQARQENVRNGEDERASEHNAKTRGDDDKAAKSSTPATDARGRQAADLAQRVGPGERVAVEVNVTDDAKTLVSRPAATLAAATTHGDGGKSASSQAAKATTADPQGNVNGLMGAAAPAAVAQATNAPQTAILKAGAGAEIGAATAAQNTTNAFGQAQGAAAGPAATNAQSAAQTAASNAAQTAQRPAASFRAEILEQISVNIQKAVKDGTDKISIQLRPAELGRVDVRIEVAADGRAHVHVTADRSDTLDLLQRDARDLARALQDAGLRADAGNLQFSLREQAADQRQGRARSNGGAQGIDATNAADSETAGIVPAWTPTAQPGRVDIRA